MKRTGAVFLCAAGAILALAILKALVVSGLGTLPAVKVLIFASSTFGLIAALLDWAVLRDLFPRANKQPRVDTPHRDPILERARIRPIVFHEICPPPAASLSFYGGLPIGPAQLVWPRVRHKPGDTPLSFLMQWDCRELSGQDGTGLLPRDGVLYLFADLNWGEPFDFQFIHAKGPVDGWQALPAPPDLPAIYGGDGAYQVPYCSPLIAKERQDVPRLLPKWPFTPLAFSYPVATGASNAGNCYWNDGEAVAEELLRSQYPQGVPATRRMDKQQSPFGRPFATFPHDYAAVRVVAARALEQLRQASQPGREARFLAWRDEAARHYEFAATHPPHAKVEQSVSDDIWRWMEGLEPVLGPGWGSVVEESVNVSLGLGSEAATALPAAVVGACADRHKLAPVHSTPNHMFGPPSFVQGHVEEFLEEWILMLELSIRRPIGHEFGEGVLQFLIRPADLRESRFDRVILVASAY